MQGALPNHYLEKTFLLEGFMDHIDNALIRYRPAGAVGMDLDW